jgi:hypothetical protein
VFANAFTSWLLPWLALTAQLPFEAKNPVENLMILFMAVGSPALITYSLTLTILNRIWVRRIFGSLQEKLNDVPKELRHGLREQLRAAQYLLQESQQVPMRASQVDGWLSSLVALDKNHGWWTTGKKDLKNTRRGYTFSLFAQISMAFLAYTLTIAISLNSASLGSSLGDGVRLTAGGGIWIWMIPVILGWIMCGTQARSCAITNALNNKIMDDIDDLDDETHSVFRVDKEGNILRSDIQHGICSRSGLIPRPQFLEVPSTSPPTAAIPAETRSSHIDGLEVSNPTEVTSGEGASHAIAEVEEFRRLRIVSDSSIDGGNDISDVTVLEITERKSDRRPVGEFPFGYEGLKLPSWLGFSIEGDEALEGSLFNYARLFTFREFSSTIGKAFSAHLQSLKDGDNKKNNIVEVAESCRLDKALQAYTPWQEIDSMVWHHMLIAAGAAMFVQWGTASTTHLFLIH